jgi:hypothetical protein
MWPRRVVLSPMPGPFGRYRSTNESAQLLERDNDYPLAHVVGLRSMPDAGLSQSVTSISKLAQPTWHVPLNSGWRACAGDSWFASRHRGRHEGKTAVVAASALHHAPAAAARQLGWAIADRLLISLPRPIPINALRGQKSLMCVSPLQ